MITSFAETKPVRRTPRMAARTAVIESDKIHPKLLRTVHTRFDSIKHRLKTGVHYCVGITDCNAEFTRLTRGRHRCYQTCLKYSDTIQLVAGTKHSCALALFITLLIKIIELALMGLNVNFE
jgi:hypothetical protein